MGSLGRLLLHWHYRYCSTLPVWERAAVGQQRYIEITLGFLKILIVFYAKPMIECVFGILHIFLKTQGQGSKTNYRHLSDLLRPHPVFFCEKRRVQIKRHMGPPWVWDPLEQGLKKKTRSCVWKRESSLHEPHLFCGREGRWSSVQGTQRRSKTGTINSPMCVKHGVWPPSDSGNILVSNIELVWKGNHTFTLPMKY